MIPKSSRSLKRTVRWESKADHSKDGGDVMTPHSERLTELDKSFVNERTERGWVAAFAGGSVGRGEADEWSGLDLNVYVEDGSTLPGSRNETYRDDVIQLHVHRIPDLADVLKRPWAYRFLLEGRKIWDPRDAFVRLQQAAAGYFRSAQGRKRMKEQAEREVREWMALAQEAAARDKPVTAGVLALAAWIDAAFAFHYFRNGRVATGDLLAAMRRTNAYAAFRRTYLAGRGTDTAEQLRAVRAYRRFLRERLGSGFELDEIQDRLMERKMARCAARGDLETALWLLQSEALWCSRSEGEGIPDWDAYLSDLPDDRRAVLEALGFRPWQPDEVRTLVESAREVLRMC